MQRNPYTTSSSNLFYGRETLFRELIGYEQSGKPVILVGGRRCGKTRLLRRLEGYLRALGNGQTAASGWAAALPDRSDQPAPEPYMPPHWPVLVNMEGRRFSGVEDVLDEIVETVLDQLPDGLVPPARPDESWNERRLGRWLLALDTELDGSGLGGLALLFDEIERILDTDWCHDLLAFLRRLVDSDLGTRLWVLLAGADGLDRYRHPGDGSPPLNVGEPCHMGDLDYRARRRMATEPFVEAGRLPLDDAVLQAVDRVAAGQPWLLTNLLERLFNAEEPDSVELERAEGQLLDRYGETIFERWSQPIDEAGWGLYRQLVNLGSVAADLVERDARQRAARALLEYQGLAHRNASGDTELGPTLFRRWAKERGLVGEPFRDRAAGGVESGSLPPGHYRFDVAISYASPQAEMARALAERLRQLKLEVFRDRERSHELWAADLEHFLPRTYDREARFAVLLVTRDYLERYWTGLEARAALTKALREGWGAVLPVSIAGARLPEVPEGIVRLELTAPDAAAADQVALEVMARLRGEGR